MTEPVIELERVEKRFGPHQVLRGLDLTVAAGEILGFVGPNGSGKTTCLRTLIGLTFRTGGSALVLGMDPSRRPVQIRRRAAYLPGETSLYPELTGAQIMRFAHAGYARRDDQVAGVLQQAFGLPLDRRVREYSAGMKRKLALMIALVPDVDLYLLDEPDRNLDMASHQCVRDVVQGLAERQKTVIVCSHDLDEVDAVADRVAFLLDGKILDDRVVREARDALRREVRLRLTPDTALPDGTLDVVHEPSGCVRVRTEEDPLRWVARLDPARVLSVELGATSLDLLYQRLTSQERS